MNNNGASVHFDLTDEQKEIQQLARRFAREKISPAAEHYDRTHEYPWPLIREAQEMGLTTMVVPEEYGGLGLSLFEEILVAEELAWGCTGVSTAIGVNGLAFLPIKVAGSHEQKKEYGGRMADGQLASYCLTEPEAGSDVAGIRTTARRDGDKNILNVSKTFITRATVAGFYTVFAYTRP